MSEKVEAVSKNSRANTPLVGTAASWLSSQDVRGQCGIRTQNS